MIQRWVFEGDIVSVTAFAYSTAGAYRLRRVNLETKTGKRFEVKKH
jgi:hypothetical protein